MPELPEVETVRQGLLPAMEGSAFKDVEVRREGLRWPFPENMRGRLVDARVRSLRRRSKYILVDLSTEETLIIHLGMSGRILVAADHLANFANAPAVYQKHDHVVFHMQNGAVVTFNDPRRFGAMDLAPTDQLDNHKLLSSLGPEPLGNAFDETYLADVLTGRKTPIKSALLDQKIVAGLGNIYVCEVLHRAGISPTRHCARISRSRISSLVPLVRDVLNEAIAAGGSSLNDYRQTDGELGYFQHSFAVYDREGDPCLKDGCGGTISRIVQSGRSSFYCSTCQR